MRSSNLKYYVDDVYLKHYAKRKRFSRTGSFVLAVIVAISIVAIPGTSIIMHVRALSENVEPVAVVNTSDISDVAEIGAEDKADKSNVLSENNENTELIDKTASISSLETDEYTPVKITLSAYDRAKVERLVTGEAGILGYDGCLLVAQAIHDGMVLSNTTSIDKIIADYQYAGSTEGEATEDAKKAVAHIFDDNGYAVKERVLYFYATDIVSSPWHETQEYVTTCGNMKFFDKWE